MFVSAFAALALFAAPDAAQSGAASDTAPAAEATPAMRKVCTSVEMAGSKLPKKTCKMVPVKAERAKVAEETSPKAEETSSQ